MRAVIIVRRRLQKRFQFLHAKTETALWRGVNGVVNGGQLWLTGLGRRLPGDSTDKHRIKAADRLLGNEHVQSHLVAIYSGLSSCLMAGIDRPCVSIDWTGAGPHHHMLSASLCFFGRAFPIFSRVYPNSKAGSPTAEFQFLLELHKVVPASCKPILVTDAGFHLLWFERVVALGWDFVGRIRGSLQVQVKDRWWELTELHQTAGRSPRDLGVVPISKQHPRLFRVVVAPQRKSKHRSRLTFKGTPRRNTESRRAMKAAREPWVLATSTNLSAQKVIRRYATRMQIEECFRDLKAHRHGWSLDYVCSKNSRRIEVLVLLATLAILAMHVIGLAGENAKAHFGYQANTVRHRRVLSTFFLARLLVRDGTTDSLSAAELSAAMRQFEKALYDASHVD